MNHALPFRVSVDRDVAGLQQACRALFEEALQQHRLVDILARCSDQEAERILADLPTREISPGYYSRASYFMDLANTLELGIPLDPAVFTAADIAGVAAVRRARQEFIREHPACTRCGERQDNPHMKQCFSCNSKLGGGPR